MLEGVAKKNQILVDENTFEQIRESFDCTPAHIEGFPANITTFELIRRVGPDSDTRRPNEGDNVDLSMSVSTDPETATIITNNGEFIGESKAS